MRDFGQVILKMSYKINHCERIGNTVWLSCNIDLTYLIALPLGMIAGRYQTLG